MKKTLVLLLLTCFCVLSFAQKVSLTKGDFTPLKGQKFINIKYDYSNVSVGDFKKEQDYIDAKVAEYNKKEAGKGDSWKTAWFNDRPTRFEPKFEELINEYLGRVNVAVSQNNKEAEYTIIVRLLFVEPGYNVYFSRKPAMINTEIDLVKTSNPSVVLGTLSAKNMPGSTYGGYDFDTGVRIAESFAKCGKEVGYFLIKKVLN